MPLLVEPEALPQWVSAEALVFLVGGYDGNASFGGVAQLLGALRVVESAAELVTPVVVVEADLRDEHCRIASTWPDELAPRLVAFFAGPGEHVPDGLVPLPSLANAVGVALHLYGGGHGTRNWGARKAAMADAVRDWVAGPWPELDGPPVLATGLQVDASQVDEPDGLGAWLRRARFLTGRDAASVSILSGLNERAELGPDDALGVLVEAAPAALGSATSTDRFRVGVHVNAEARATTDPDRRRSLVAAAVTSVCSRDARPSDIVPILAVEGALVRESGTFASLAPLLGSAGSVTRDPIDLSTAHGVARLPSLDAVVACSYHVALASAVHGVPTWLVVDNERDEQELRGIEDQVGVGRVGAVRVPDHADSAPHVDPLPPDEATAGVDTALLRRSVTAARAEAGQALALSLLEQSSRHVGALSRAYADTAADAARLRTVVGDYIQAVEASARREIRMQGEVDATNEQVEGLLRQADALRAHLHAIEQSRIWRVSAPYRRLRTRLGGSSSGD